MALAGACGGPSSRLVTVRSAAGEGAVEFEVQNETDVPINNLYIAKTSAVRQAPPEQMQPDSTQGQELWGPDLLAGALERGGRQRLIVPEPGSWDIKALDRDGRYQHVSGLKLGAGGRYILELHDGSWRVIQ